MVFGARDVKPTALGGPPTLQLSRLHASSIVEKVYELPGSPWKSSDERSSRLVFRGVDMRRLSPDDWAEMRDIRLTALQEAPNAFGSTYAREAAFAETDWRGRLERPTAVTYLAAHTDFADGPVGIAGGYVNPETGLSELVAMWVRPEARGRGVGVELVETVVTWAKSLGVDRIQLWVAEVNPAALKLYERCGFTLTGERGELPHNESVTELRMVRPL
jgi:GNAT superfamily N-acetyltransferase